MFVDLRLYSSPLSCTVRIIKSKSKEYTNSSVFVTFRQENNVKICFNLEVM